MVFRAYASDTQALEQAKSLPVVGRLLWFNHGFMKAEVREQKLVLSDLRMGAEPDYSFRFVVAERDGDGWRAHGPEQAQWPWEAGRRLAAMWDRIWVRPSEELRAIELGTNQVPVPGATETQPAVTR